MQFVVLKYRHMYVHPVHVSGNTRAKDILGRIVGAIEDVLPEPFQEHGTDVRLHVTGTGVGPSNIFERVELGDDHVAFRASPWTDSAAYLEAHSGNDFFPQGAVILRRHAGLVPENRFKEVWLDDVHVALQTSFGTFVTAENDGKVDELVVDRDVIGEWQNFTYEMPPEGLLPAPPEPARKPAPVSVKEAMERIEDVDVTKDAIRVSGTKPRIDTDMPIQRSIKGRFPAG